MLKEFSLEGKTALVTGGGRGIGRAIAHVFAEAGADVAVVSRTMSQVETVAKEIEAIGRRSVALQGDVTDHQQVEDFVARATDALGKIDIMVNNAGAWDGRALVVPLPDSSSAPPAYSAAPILTIEDWDKLVSTNLTSAFYCCRAVGPQMLERRSGKVINVLSSFAGIAFPATAPYSASKAGLRMLTKVLALEWASHNVNVNAIGPGTFETEMTRGSLSDPDHRKRVISRIPLGRFTDVRDVGFLALYLASPASDWMTGQVIYLDGGDTAPVD